MRHDVMRIRYEIGKRAAALWSTRAELLVASAFLAGWMLVTVGIVSYTSAKVWPISIGILLLSLCGWKWLWALTTKGLYTLASEERSDG